MVWGYIPPGEMPPQDEPSPDVNLSMDFRLEPVTLECERLRHEAFRLEERSIRLSASADKLQDTMITLSPSIGGVLETIVWGIQRYRASKNFQRAMGHLASARQYEELVEGAERFLHIPS